MEPRIASSVLVSALLRRAEGEGGFGTVLAKGDATAGAVAVILLERGANPRVFERALQPEGRYAWRESALAGESPQDLAALLDRRRRFDPDLWIIELDIASSERFAAEMNSFG
ncbi:MAG TPA: DUF1491 family protein [Allosphingosinicella sp.]|jgi:hypothetical protein|nr:DUF1491 family protein [Allosphingosinicella sp.]